MMHVIDQVGAVVREVRTGERGGKPTRIVIASRSFDTEPEDVWDAITNRDRIPRWLMPISGDLRLGGRYQLEGNAGGEITRCDRPERLAVTWEYGDSVSWVDAQLGVEAGGGTLLRLEHVLPADEHWEKYGPGAVGVGWDLMLLGLHLYLATGESMNPETSAAFMASTEGQDFVRTSSERWGEAALTIGTSPDAAQAAARRTTAFFTGEPEA